MTLEELKRELSEKEEALELARYKYDIAAKALVEAADAVTITRNLVITRSPHYVQPAKVSAEIKDRRRSFVKNAIRSFNREFF